MLNSKFLDGEIPSISSLKGNNFADDILKPALHEPELTIF